QSVHKRINCQRRIPRIGLISQYSHAKLQPGPNLGSILINRALIQGMIISDHFDRLAEFLRERAPWVREGKIHYREDRVQGRRTAPASSLSLLNSTNIGKRLIQVS